MEDTISFEGVDVAELVHALYLGTAPLGFGFLYDVPDLTVEQVREDLARHGERSIIRIDYYRGRPLKVDLDMTAKTFRTGLYDRDAGHGRAAEIVGRLRKATPVAG